MSSRCRRPGRVRGRLCPAPRDRSLGPFTWGRRAWAIRSGSGRTSPRARARGRPPLPHLPSSVPPGDRRRSVAPPPKMQDRVARTQENAVILFPRAVAGLRRGYGGGDQRLRVAVRHAPEDRILEPVGKGPTQQDGHRRRQARHSSSTRSSPASSGGVDGTASLRRATPRAPRGARASRSGGSGSRRGSSSRSRSSRRETAPREDPRSGSPPAGPSPQGNAA